MDDKWRTCSCYACCNGIMWGVENPDECNVCGGSGRLFVRPKGHLFAWPGGPALGLGPKEWYDEGTPVEAYA